MFCPGLVCHIAHLMYVLYLYTRNSSSNKKDLLFDENKERGNKDMNKRYKMVKFFGNEYIIV